VTDLRNVVYAQHFNLEFQPKVQLKISHYPVGKIAKKEYEGVRFC